MAADGSIVIDTKIDDSGIPKQLGKMKTSLAQAAKTLALPVAIAAGAIAAVSKIVGYMGELNKIYMVQASAERALSQAAANNPYLTGESVNNLKRYASELQKVSNYGDEVTIGLMTQLAAAGRTESEIQSIIKASADLAASGTTTLDGAVKNLNKTYSGLSGELGEVIPELKTLTAEQMKNGDAVDLIAKKYAGMAESVVDKSTQMHNAMGDLKEQMGRGLSPVVDGLSGLFGSLAAKMAEALSAANDLRDAEKAIANNTETTSQALLVYQRDLNDLNKDKEQLLINLKATQSSDPFYEEIQKEITATENLIKMKQEQIERTQKQAEIEKRLAHANSIGSKDAAEKASKELEASKKTNEKTAALVKAYSEWEAAQTRANKAAEMGVTTQDEQMQELKRAAQEYQEKLVDITLQYGALGDASSEAFRKAQAVTSDQVIPKGSVIGGPVMPTGSSSSTIAMIMDLIAKANEGGDKAGKELTNSMASAIDDTSVGVSDSIGAVMDNIGAAITIAIAVVKKIFAGIKAVAKFDPIAMYESFTEIITGLTEFFAKVGSLPSLVEAGKKVLDEFIRGMIENRETHKETFSNVVKYLLETARDELPFVIEFAFMIVKDLATGIIENLPLLIDTAFAIITALSTGILDALPTLILAAGDILPALLYSIITGIPMFYLTVIEHLPEIITAIIEATIKMLPELTMAIIQAWIQTMYIMPALIIAALVGLLLEVVVNLITDIYTLFTPAGAAIWEGIGQGIKDGWARFAEDIRKAFQSIGDMFKAIFGIHSPSTVFAGFGAMIMEGLKNGITGANIWDGIKSTFTTIIDNIKKLFSAGTWTDIGGSIINGITNIVTTVGGGISDIVTTVGGGISNVVSTVGGWIGGLFNADGTNNFRGGKAIINEKGAEMVTLPSGSKIMTANATAQMQDRAISQLLSGMKMPSFATAGSGGNKSITIENKINAPIIVEGSVFGRLVYETIDKAVV